MSVGRRPSFRMPTYPNMGRRSIGDKMSPEKKEKIRRKIGVAELVRDWKPHEWDNNHLRNVETLLSKYGLSAEILNEVSQYAETRYIIGYGEGYNDGLSEGTKKLSNTCNT